jgi:hypothetical protein
VTELKDAIEHARAVGEAGFPRSPGVRTEVERQLQGLDQQVGAAEPVEDLRPWLERAARRGAANLRRFELNRALRGAWCEPEFDDLGLDAVHRGTAEARRSSDQATIEGYLTWFPGDRDVIGRLSAAARAAAERHEWAWRRRSERWQLFDHEAGPASVGGEMAGARAEDVAALLSEIGIGPQIAATRFGRAAFRSACVQIAGMVSARATQAQAGLLRLFDARVQAGDLPQLVRALLQPWTAAKPDTEHRRLLSAFLVEQIGDPRVNPGRGRWRHVADDLARTIGRERADAIVQVLKRWLTDVAMREFFRAIARTTDRPDQWKQRSEFWLAYLDAGLVSDAWPALGQRARHGIEQIMRQSGEAPEFGVMKGGPVSSSTILMQIGDVRIAEWSDNGSCRFWSVDDRKAPGLYQKAYDGGELRTTQGRRDFEYHSHVPASPGWEGKFAAIIHRRTGVTHPTLGRGRARNRNDQW